MQLFACPDTGIIVAAHELFLIHTGGYQPSQAKKPGKPPSGGSSVKSPQRNKKN